MISFIISIIVLIAAYFIYGKFIEKQFGIDPNRKTPAHTKYDGVDFIPLKTSKVFLIQFLNIAGIGPIFGAIAGALWGPAAFLWIVFGCIFAGGVHDYFSGMLSLRHDGASIPEIVGQYLGKGMQNFMRIFAVLLLILVGVVFVKGPASILTSITGVNISIFIGIIFIYFIFATLVPVDKLIGKIYPVFGISLLIMAAGIFFALIWGNYPIPELIPSNLINMHQQPEKFPLFPMLFITIACGAISGFHSTQSPLMARCITNEKEGRKVFFGAMIAEGIVALIWAAASMSFFGGVREFGVVMAEEGHNAAWAVNEICNSLLGKVGGILAILGVVAAPITSGDTAFRSARLTLADSFKLNQNSIGKRLLITLPLFVVGAILTQVDFGIIWRYFGWANQTLATIVLWTSAVYMLKSNKKYLFILIPALFMTTVIVSYILIAPEGFHINKTYAYTIGISCSIILMIVFLIYSSKVKRSQNNPIE